MSNIEPADKVTSVTDPVPRLPMGIGNIQTLALHPQAKLPGQVTVTLGGTPGIIRAHYWDGGTLDHGEALIDPPPADIRIEPLAPGNASVDITFTGTGIASNYTAFRSLPITTWGVNIDVTSSKAGVSPNPPPFAVGKIHPFDPTKRGNAPDPDKHFVVFYKDVVDSDFTAQDFSIKLKANVTPSSASVLLTNPRWTKLSGPNSGALSTTTGVEVNYMNPKEGGVYRFAFDADGFPRTEFSVVLPLAGAEMDSVIQSDLTRANTFVTAVTARYSEWELRDTDNWDKWFVISHAGDYTGRPDNKATPTVWLYNQVDDESGFGVACTWKGRSVLLTKPSNFILGYAIQKIGGSRIKAQTGTISWRNIITWTFTDAASVGAGWDVANGENYDTTVSALVDYIWTHEKENDKSRKVWPNSNAPDNYKGSSSRKFDYDVLYGDPGFLYMTR